MTTTINQYGEKVTVIGTVVDRTGNRQDVIVTEFTSCGKPCFSLKSGFGGYPDARRFSTQVKRAKFVFSNPTNKAEWNV